MRRVTIAEAALALDASKEEIAFRTECGSLVACQEPAFKGYVWINADITAAPKRRTQDFSKPPTEKTPPDDSVEIPDESVAEPQVEIPVEALLEPSVEIPVEAMAEPQVAAQAEPANQPVQVPTDASAEAKPKEPASLPS